MMMKAYNEVYLSDAMKNLGGMLDYAVNDCGFAADEILNMFIISGKADLFGTGDPALVTGMSGEELAVSLIRESGLIREIPPSSFRAERTKEYWCGWILAYLQWETAWSFRWICSSCPAEEILALYPILHEASEQKASSVLRNRIENARKQTQLQRMRLYAGMTQAALAQKAEVSLRSVQMYEQRRKDINKAQAETLFRLAAVLGCREKDLLECK
jgi:DNA-binding XRE family transcriptional regulator